MTCDSWRFPPLGLAMLLCFSGCTNLTSSQGIHVDIDMRREGDSAATLSNAEGYSFVVNKALLVISAVELVPCEATLMTKIVDNLRLTSVAKAHGPLLPTSYAVPQVIDLMADVGTDRFVAHIEPPPGRYCALRLLSAPADGDAEGVDEHMEIVSRALYVVGEYSMPASASARTMAIESTMEQTAELAFDDGELELSAAASQINLRLTISHAAMFEGIMPPTQDPMWQAYAVQKNLLSQIHLTICDADGC